jgi:hypothetical protein
MARIGPFHLEETVMPATYTPRPRLTDGRFDMTASVDGDGRYTVAVGYCAGPRAPYNLLPSPVTDFTTQEQWETTVGIAEKYHLDGHETAEDAARCWAGFIVNTQSVTTVTPDAQERCGVCGEFTFNLIQIGRGSTFSLRLCDEHNSAENSLPPYLATLGL